VHNRYILYFYILLKIAYIYVYSHKFTYLSIGGCKLQVGNKIGTKYHLPNCLSQDIKKKLLNMKRDWYIMFKGFLYILRSIL